eukprot:Skav236278  [mRNA]  locus=scaffold2289:169896:172349:+ [translate_table: standard]
MALTNILIHKFMTASSQQAVFTSYVDNYEFESQCIQHVAAALEKLEGFCTLLDLALDKEKTFRWAIQPQARSQLRQMEIIPVQAAKDLGGHMQYSSKQGNRTVVSRMQALGDLWHKLAVSPSSQAQKVRILRTVAWPRGLHGSSIVHIGGSHFEALRTQAAQSIGHQKAGMNPQIMLGLMEQPIVDPEYVVIMDSILQCRRQASSDMLAFALQQCAALPDIHKKPGPAGVLASRVAMLGWTYTRGTQFLDDEQNPVDILRSPLPEIKARAARAWGTRVGTIWESRKEFQGLGDVSAVLSRPSANWSAEEAGVLRSVMSGAQFTDDAKAHFEESRTDICKHCHLAQDSMYHRHWECSATERSRQQVPEDVVQSIHSMPICASHRGWICEPPSLAKFRKLLHAIPDTTEAFEADGADARNMLGLFVDGSGRDPALPLARIVGWAVVLAGATLQDDATIVSSGGVPGSWQTVPRAELTSLLSAMKYAKLMNKPCRIWCDNQGVTSRAQAIQDATCHVQANMADHDLWEEVAALLPCMPACSFQPIRSRQDKHMQPSWKVWAFENNEFADAQASRAIQQLPAELLSVQQEVVRDIQSCARLQEALHAHFIRVGMANVLSTATSRPTSVELPTARREDEQIINFQHVSNHAATRAPQNLSFPGFAEVLQWMQQVHDDDAPVVMISWYELLADFQIRTGRWGVKSVPTHAKWDFIGPSDTYDCQKACRLTACFLTKLIRLAVPSFKGENSRPYNYRFQCWTMGVRMRVSATTRSNIDSWMKDVFEDRQITSIATWFDRTGPATLGVRQTGSSRRGFGLRRYFA